MFIKQPALDWLTLSEKLEGVAGLYGWVKGARRVKLSAWRQFKGAIYKKKCQRGKEVFTAEFFYGETAPILAGARGLLVLAGENAEFAREELAAHLRLYPDVYATRLDTQITVPWPLALHLGSVEVNHPGVITRIESTSLKHTGETLYVGSRQSERMLRAYRKYREGVPDVAYLRAEIEYKGHMARSAWEYCKRSGEPAGGFDVYQMKVPGIWDWIERYIGSDAFEAVWLREGSKTIKWLQEQVTPALSRVLTDHTQRGDALQIIAVWNALARDGAAKITWGETEAD